VVRDGSRTTKNLNPHERHYWHQFYDATLTNAKRILNRLTISIPAASTIFNFAIN